jgi:hypothetical protein
LFSYPFYPSVFHNNLIFKDSAGCRDLTSFNLPLKKIVNRFNKVILHGIKLKVKEITWLIEGRKSALDAEVDAVWFCLANNLPRGSE